MPTCTAFKQALIPISLVQEFSVNPPTSEQTLNPNYNEKVNVPYNGPHKCPINF